MAVARKLAVGSEDYYPSYAPKQKRKIRIKKSVSPVAGVVVGTFLIVCIFCTGLSYLYLKASIAKINLQIRQVEESNTAIIAENEKLKVKVAGLKSLDRVETVAISELGMVKNPQIEYLAYDMKMVETEGIRGVAAENISMDGKKGQTETQISAGDGIFKRIAEALFARG